MAAAEHGEGTEMVLLAELLSTCVEACGLGMEEIRKVQARRDSGRLPLAPAETAGQRQGRCLCLLFSPAGSALVHELCHLAVPSALPSLRAWLSQGDRPQARRWMCRGRLRTTPGAP